METSQYDFVEAILTAHQLGKRDGFESALDVRSLIEEDGFTYNPVAFEDDGFGDADAIYLEALGARMADLEERVKLIEQHYLGVDYRPDLASQNEPRPGRFGDLRYAASGACDDSSCDCGDVHH